MIVYVVQHEHPVLDGDAEEVKFIGVYSSREGAERAVERLRRAPGFVDWPEGFTIDAYRLDEDHWTEGFVTITHPPPTS